MELPDDVLVLIREFSRPLSRPGCRTMKRMSLLRFHYLASISQPCIVLDRFVSKIERVLFYNTYPITYGAS